MVLPIKYSIAVLGLIYIVTNSMSISYDTEFMRAQIEKSLEETLRVDKGTGCIVPQLDPFAKEIINTNNIKFKIKCTGIDWVKCYPIEVLGVKEFVLLESDYAVVHCEGLNSKKAKLTWLGVVIGMRNLKQVKLPEDLKNDLNVLIFGFDSMSSNGFIREMPKSYSFMRKTMNMTILKGYNIVGDGTPAALFPILSGKTELEYPDLRKSTGRQLDEKTFIFYKMKQLGYHTAYFEDMPHIGTFQYRLRGFKNTPADHYLRSFYIKEGLIRQQVRYNWYCVGETPRFRLMFNITHQFLQLPGNKFGFTFIADITHEGNYASNADEDLVNFMKMLIKDGRTDDTIFILMADHGPRFSNVRRTVQGKIEERLPMMSLYLPKKLRARRPDTLRHLQRNANVLTTPHDIYATVLDALDLRHYWNPHKVKGADLTRGLTLLEPIPKSRSCSEGGIEAHWCSCLTWSPVSKNDTMYKEAANALVNFINNFTATYRRLCAKRKLKSIHWVTAHKPSRSVLDFNTAMDADGYVGKFKHFDADILMFQVKITASPGAADYEASLRYKPTSKTFNTNTRDISRTNAYKTEPWCISDTLPHLNKFCFCKNDTRRTDFKKNETL